MLSEDLRARIEEECSFNDIQDIIEIIAKDKVLYTYWEFGDMCTVCNIDPEQFDDEEKKLIIQCMDKLDYYPSSSEDITDNLPGCIGMVMGVDFEIKEM